MGHMLVFGIDWWSGDGTFFFCSALFYVGST
jgi:hypothetical protein